jgi:hypothetical protein
MVSELTDNARWTVATSGEPLELTDARITTSTLDVSKSAYKVGVQALTSSAGSANLVVRLR